MPFVPWADDGVMVTSGTGKHAPNPWGLFDLHGNAAEWTLSLHRPYPYSADNGCENPRTEGAPAWRKLPNVGFRVVTPAEAVPAQVAAK